MRGWIKNELNLLTPTSDQANEGKLLEEIRMKNIELETARQMEEDRLA